MSDCKDCNSSSCPDSLENRQIVDEVISTNFQWVDMNDILQVEKTINNILIQLKSEWIKPCSACLNIEEFLNNRK